MRKILIVEDDEAINRLLCMNLGVVGYAVTGESDGLRAKARIEAGEKFDLAVLDVMLPGIDGFSLLGTFRSRGIPVIFLTAKGEIEDRVRGLKEGAEDYMTKPFALPELLLRIEKALSHYAGDPTLELGDVSIDVDRRAVTKAGEPLDLTPTQYELLLLLARHRNVALSRERILSAVWNSDFYGESRTIDNHISQLRRKTGLNIVAVSRVGYRLEI